MFLSKKTIDGLRLKIKSELNVRNSIGIVKYAIKNGLYKVWCQKEVKGVSDNSYF